MDYQNVKLIQARRQKVLMLSIIISIFIHLLLFFAFRIKFLGYKTVKVSKIMRIRRVRIPQGKRPGPLSASSARKRAKPTPVKKRSRTKTKRPRKRKPIKSKIKVASKNKQKPEEQVEVALEQKESEYDVLSMIEGDMVIPGGGNLGDDEDAFGVNYGEDTEYEYGEYDEEPEVASAQPEKFLGTMATPIVTSKPYTSIVETYSDIPYPDDVKIKKEKLQSGICRVFIRISVNHDGSVDGIYVRSPKTDADKQKYKIFLDSVLNTVNEWTFDPMKATVFVDVRFTIE